MYSCGEQRDKRQDEKVPVDALGWLWTSKIMLQLSFYERPASATSGKMIFHHESRAFVTSHKRTFFCQ